jgi:hypothetical protein
MFTIVLKENRQYIGYFCWVGLLSQICLGFHPTRSDIDMMSGGAFVQADPLP